MSKEFKAALLAVVALLIGAAIVELFHFLNDTRPGEPGVITQDNTELLEEIGALRRQVGELRATTLLGPNAEAAKPAAAEAAIAAAEAVGLRAPTVPEIVEDSMTATSKERLNEELDKDFEELNEALKSQEKEGVNVAACKDLLLQVTTAPDKRAALTSPDVVAKVRQCKQQSDEERRRIQLEKERLNCDADPTQPECRKLDEQEKRSDDVDRLIKLILVVAAIYFMMNGDIATGLLLLSMANGMGEGGSGSGSGNGSSPDTASGSGRTTEVVGPAPDTATGSGLGTGGDIVCNPIDTILSCVHKDGSKKVRINPAVFSPEDLSEGQKLAKDALTAAIADPNSGAKLVLCESAKPSADSAFTKAFILSINDRKHFFMNTQTQVANVEVIIRYPDGDVPEMPSCDNADE